MGGNIMTMYGPDNGAVTHIEVYQGVMAGINIVPWRNPGPGPLSWHHNTVIRVTSNH